MSTINFLPYLLLIHTWSYALLKSKIILMFQNQTENWFGQQVTVSQKMVWKLLSWFEYFLLPLKPVGTQNSNLSNGDSCQMRKQRRTRDGQLTWWVMANWMLLMKLVPSTFSRLSTWTLASLINLNFFRIYMSLLKVSPKEVSWDK